MYDFTESRSAERPREILRGYTGFIHADAYPGYDSLFGPGGATEVACWAHARRKFLDAEKTEPDLAKGAVDRIARLYAIEARAREQELEPQARSRLREAEATPVLEELHAYLSATETQVLAKSPMATALRYALNLWPALTVYVTNGLLNIDNNPAENAIRPVAVGRKNWLFVQNVDGGRRLATLQSLLFTAKAIGINTSDYLADVLVRIAHETDVKKLTPHGWKAHFQAEVGERLRGAEKRLLGVRAPPARYRAASAMSRGASSDAYAKCRPGAGTHRLALLMKGLPTPTSKPAQLSSIYDSIRDTLRASSARLESPPRVPARTLGRPRSELWAKPLHPGKHPRYQRTRLPSLP